MKRILDCRGSDFRQMGREELKQAIRAAEGRTILAETVVTSQPLLPEVSNPEVMKAFGADMILLYLFDCFNPVVNGIESYSIFQPNAAGSEIDENIIQKISLGGRLLDLKEPKTVCGYAVDNLTEYFSKRVFGSF